MNKFRFFMLVLFLSRTSFLFAAIVDSPDVPSAAMNRTYKAAVVLPASYAKAKLPTQYCISCMAVVNSSVTGLPQRPTKCW